MNQLTPEQIEEYSKALGWPPELVIAWASYFVAGGPVG